MQRNCIFPGRYAPLTYRPSATRVLRNSLLLYCVTSSPEVNITSFVVDTENNE